MGTQPLSAGASPARPPIGDLTLLFTEESAKWLLSLIAPIMAAGWKPDEGGGPTLQAIQDGPRMRIQVAAHLYDTADIGRARWERDQVVITAGGLVLMVSKVAMSRLLSVLEHEQ